RPPAPAAATDVDADQRHFRTDRATGRLAGPGDSRLGREHRRRRRRLSGTGAAAGSPPRARALLSAADAG
ncbi:MAG TPA: hypothetical protein VNY34_06535, partial [Solirubrobacteraceae bacterium]|nr:hypothetical protein [Solirubrobacteraceae bacterium]